jgi:hypothetical protein
MARKGATQFFCRACIAGGPDAPRAVGTFRAYKPRRQPDPMTFLVFCRLCEAEVYRLEHVTRRTAKVRELVDTMPSLAWLKHAHTMRALGGSTAYEHNQRNWQAQTWRGEPNPDANVLALMTQTAWVNETSYDPSLQVGDPNSPVLPERMRMLNVLPIGFGVTRMSDEQYAELARRHGDAWNNPPDLDGPYRH